MPLDLAGRHAAGIHAHDLAVELWKTALVFGDQQWIEDAVPIARDVQDGLAVIGRHRLAATAIAAVACLILALGSFFGALPAKVFLHLGRQRAFRQRFRQLGKIALLTNRSSADRPSISLSNRSLSMPIRGSPFRAVITPKHKIQDSPEDCRNSARCTFLSPTTSTRNAASEPDRSSRPTEPSLSTSGVVSGAG